MSLRLVKVPDAAPPYDCPTHGAGCPAMDAAGGQDNGVFPYQYSVNRRDPNVEGVAKYLPTIESEDYLLRGQAWGSSVYKMTVLKCEVLPRGDIFGDA